MEYFLDAANDPAVFEFFDVETVVNPNGNGAELSLKRSMTEYNAIGNQFDVLVSV